MMKKKINFNSFFPPLLTFLASYQKLHINKLIMFTEKIK
jgi:hypothetical protein